MPRFSKKVLSQHLRTQCERQLRLNLYPNAERKRLGMPEEAKARGGLHLLQEAGDAWQDEVLGDLDDTFGSKNIIGRCTGKTKHGFRYEAAPLEHLIRLARPDRFLIEAKYAVEVRFQKAHGAHDIRDYRGKRMSFSNVIPDLIQVFAPADGDFERYVTPGGAAKRLSPGDERLRLRVIDVKLTSAPSAHYFAEVVYYSMTLAAWLLARGLDDRFVVVPEAAVWPGSHQGSHLHQKMREWQSQGQQNPSFQKLRRAMGEDLEIAPHDVFAPRLRRLIGTKLQAVLGEPDWKNHSWHVDGHCKGCDFLGYPWGNGTPNPDHCWPMADQQDDLSRVASISRGSSEVLRDGGVRDVPTLAQKKPRDDVFTGHQELQARRTVVPGRAASLLSGQADVVATSGTSAVMPKWADLRLYLFVEFDLSSAISFSFGLKGFWHEPFLADSSKQRNLENWGPEVFVVDQRSIQREREVFLKFLRRLRDIMDDVARRDENADDTGRRKGRNAKSTLQLYLWDSAQQEHFTRVVGRHLDAVLADPDLEDLAWLFPSDDLVPSAKGATRESPVTVVSDAVHNHLAAPVPHVYTLMEVVETYHRQKDAQYVPSILGYFHDPLSDLIPSERGHEIWSSDDPVVKYPGWKNPEQTFAETVEKKLRALETVTSRLGQDLKDTLGYNAPGINVSSPGRVPKASWDGQLWYAFARLDAALDRLEKQQVRALPPHEREARFKSARLHHRLFDADERQALKDINQKQGLNLQPAQGRYVYKMRDGSEDVSFKPGEFTRALSPELEPGFLDRSVRSVVEGTSIESKYERKVWSCYQATMKDVMGAKIEAIDRENRLIVLRKNRYDTLIEDLEQHGLADLRKNAVLDTISKDFFTKGKLKPALRAIGNPAVAKNSPLARRALGMQGGRGSNQTAHTPAADFLWDAPATHETRIGRDWRAAGRVLQQNGFSLNFSQWKALADALTRRLSIIWGPPGTGKSRTLRTIVMAAVLEATQNDKPLRLLVTAPTYRALDNVLLKVAEELPKLLSTSCVLHRLRSKHREPDDEVPSSLDLKLNKHQPSQGVDFLLDRLRNQTGLTVVGATPGQVFNLMQTGDRAQEGLFDLALLDEASQMDTAHALLPLCALDEDASLVLAGDDRQLDPIQKAEPPEDLEHMVGSVYNFFAQHHDVPRRALNVNYRSSKEIVGFGVQGAGYPASLRAHSPDLRTHLTGSPPAQKPNDWPSHLHWTPKWNDFLDPDKPTVCFVHDDERSSQSSGFEADAVASLVFLLRKRLSCTLTDDNTRSGPFDPATHSDQTFWEKGVGIVTPHKAQMGRITTSLLKAFPGMAPAAIRSAVDTVERFQGQQRDVMIASFALGDPDAIRNEDEFLYRLNRFNVMVSRPRAKLIVFVSRSVVDHLSNDLPTLWDSRLLKMYADTYCDQETPMTLDYSNRGTLEKRNGVLRHRQ